MDKLVFRECAFIVLPPAVRKKENKPIQEKTEESPSFPRKSFRPSLEKPGLETPPSPTSPGLTRKLNIDMQPSTSPTARSPISERAPFAPKSPMSARMVEGFQPVSKGPSLSSAAARMDTVQELSFSSGASGAASAKRSVTTSSRGATANREEKYRLAKSTLIMLVVDLLISSLNMKRIGYLDSIFVLPMSGVDAYFETSTPQEPCAPTLYTPFEVYQTLDHNFTAIQLRSPVIKRKGAVFCKSLLDWIIKCQFSDIIIATGLDGTHRTDADIQVSPMKYFSFPEQHPLYRLHPTDPEPSHSGFASSLIPATANPADHYNRVPPGAGLTKVFLREAFIARLRAPILVTGWFTSEGDNIAVAMEIANSLNEKIGLQYPAGSPWKPPISWSGLFGPARFTKSLY